MKVIRIADSIISLEDVRAVRIIQHGTGAKSNPFTSSIHVAYNSGGEDASVGFADDATQTKGEEIMSKILNILGEE